MSKISIFWFRRDLRLEDNAGLYHALTGKFPVLPLFIFDTDILDKLEDKKDARVHFIFDTITSLHAELEKLDSSVLVKYGKPKEIWQQLLSEYDVQSVYTNHDYEPYAIERDDFVNDLLQSNNIAFHTYKDHVIFEKNEVVKEDGKPYTVFTPYSRKWKAKLKERLIATTDESAKTEQSSFYLQAYPSKLYFDNFYKINTLSLLNLESMGFQRSEIQIPSKEVARSIIKNYDKTRDFPAINGTSRLGIHFRFGTISIREKARHARIVLVGVVISGLELAT